MWRLRLFLFSLLSLMINWWLIWWSSDSNLQWKLLRASYFEIKFAASVLNIWWWVIYNAVSIVMSSDFHYFCWINSFLKVFRCQTEDFERLCEGLRHICLSGHAELPPLVSLVINQINAAKRWLITTKWQHDRWDLASSVSVYLLGAALNCQPLCESAFLLVGPAAFHCVFAD